MTRVSVVHGIVAVAFTISTTAAGLGLAVSSAGAGVPSDNCTGPPPVQPQAADIQPVPQRCATLEITKVVTGEPAPETTFAVGVDCAPVEIKPVSPAPATADALPPGQTPPFTTTLTFPASGGTQDVLITKPSDCTVTETPPPGCTLTSIDPVKTEIRSAIVYPVTVTNDCPPPPMQPAPAPAAVAVVQVPRFTG